MCASLERDALDVVHGGLTGCYRNDPRLDVLRGSLRNVQTGRSAHTRRDIAAQHIQQRSSIIVIYSIRSYVLVIKYALVNSSQSSTLVVVLECAVAKQCGIDTRVSCIPAAPRILVLL